MEPYGGIRRRAVGDDSCLGGQQFQQQDHDERRRQVGPTAGPTTNARYTARGYWHSVNAERRQWIESRKKMLDDADMPPNKALQRTRIRRELLSLAFRPRR